MPFGGFRGVAPARRLRWERFWEEPLLVPVRAVENVAKRVGSRDPKAGHVSGLGSW